MQQFPGTRRLLPLSTGAILANCLMISARPHGTVRARLRKRGYDRSTTVVFDHSAILFIVSIQSLGILKSEYICTTQTESKYTKELNPPHC